MVRIFANSIIGRGKKRGCEISAMARGATSCTLATSADYARVLLPWTRRKRLLFSHIFSYDCRARFALCTVARLCRNSTFVLVCRLVDFTQIAENNGHVVMGTLCIYLLYLTLSSTDQLCAKSRRSGTLKRILCIFMNYDGRSLG